MSNNDLVPTYPIAVQLSTFRLQDAAMRFLQAEAEFNSRARITEEVAESGRRPPEDAVSGDFDRGWEKSMAAPAVGPEI